jgi:ketosteroid isomerase-like protein
VGEAGEVVREALARLNSRDLDGFREICSPRLEWHDIPEIPGARTRNGPDEVREWAEDLLGVSDQVRFVNWEMSEHENAVLVDTSVEMPGSGGIDLGWRAWTVWRVREGLVAYYAGYSERDPALADFRGEATAH